MNSVQSFLIVWAELYIAWTITVAVVRLGDIIRLLKKLESKNDDQPPAS